MNPDPRVEKEWVALVEAGASVQVVCWDRNGTHPSYENRTYGPLYRLAIKAEFGRGFSNFPALLRWQAGLVVWLVRKRRTYDVIHACDFDTLLPALLMKALWRKLVVYDIFDFYADILSDGPSWVKKAIRRLDLWAIGKADMVILADEARRAQIAGSHPRLVVVVHNSPPDLRRETEHRQVEPCPTGFRIAYIGLLKRERGLFEAIDVVAKHPEWNLDLAGFGAHEEEMRTHAALVPNVHFYGRVDYTQALALSDRADVLFATYDPQIPNHRYSSANKLFEAMMLGKPIIVAHGTGMDRIVEENGSGLVVTYGDRSDLERHLTLLSQDCRLRAALGRRARAAYDTKYSWEREKKRFVDAYSDLFFSKRGSVLGQG